ncbi:helix-turn-helix domain-containing protein [Enterococcus hermanniensis]|uniref:Uncharacterized protein n=1 Tax=Enterococcus hermanniensis TaxID=249189 RepID=A0A1L8TQQ0_9ENTE|nr:helix-turn-helix domain-containing protein [Enterococcus hermanniensis]OJG46645.1 hypothetical protein RV04_GL001073 [Enterococcus hermanniensis]
MTIFILTLFRTGYKLRTSTLYHLLVGKRTSSVLLHGFFYQNLAYLGALPQLKEAKFQQAIQQLVEHQLIDFEDGYGQLTTSGKQLLVEKKIDLTGIDNLRFGRMREESWQLILFSIQVTSHLSFNEKNYLPIEHRPYYLHQIKKWLVQSDQQLVDKIQQELLTTLETLPNDAADFLANQFSGHDFQGKTVFQLLPESWKKEPWAELYRQQAIDSLLQALPDGEFKRLIDFLDQQNINRSMIKTKELFLAGKTVDELLMLRQLKQGTINDHFIEWALLDETFPFERFELLHFTGMNTDEVINARYQAYNLSYLNFRLSQIYFLRK